MLIWHKVGIDIEAWHWSHWLHVHENGIGTWENVCLENKKKDGDAC